MKITIQQPQKHGVLIPVNFKDGTYYPECWHLNDVYTEQVLDFEGERMYTEAYCTDCGRFVETLNVRQS
jgi:hypothetical protein